MGDRETYPTECLVHLVAVQKIYSNQLRNFGPDLGNLSPPHHFTITQLGRQRSAIHI